METMLRLKDRSLQAFSSEPWASNTISSLEQGFPVSAGRLRTALRLAPVPMPASPMDKATTQMFWEQQVGQEMKGVGIVAIPAGPGGRLKSEKRMR